MDLCSRLRLSSFAVIAAGLATLVVGCGKAEVTTLSGSGEGPIRGGLPGGPGIVPSFTLPDAGALAPPPRAPAPDRQCAEEAHRAEVVPLDLLLLVDASRSMEGPAGARTKWATAQTALGAFIRDPSSAGLGVGLQFFPAPRPCTTDADCIPGLRGTGLFCAARSVCAGANAPSPPLGCGDPDPIIIGGSSGSSCPAGAMCVPAGVCAGSGADCTNLGQGCPGGGGACMPARRTCAPNVLASDAECEADLHAQPQVPSAPCRARRSRCSASSTPPFPPGPPPWARACAAPSQPCEPTWPPTPGARARWCWPAMVCPPAPA